MRRKIIKQHNRHVFLMSMNLECLSFLLISAIHFHTCVMCNKGEILWEKFIKYANIEDYFDNTFIFLMNKSWKFSLYFDFVYIFQWILVLVPKTFLGKMKCEKFCMEFLWFPFQWNLYVFILIFIMVVNNKLKMKLQWILTSLIITERSQREKFNGE